MKTFKELGVETPEKAFIGRKIEINDILNCDITVHDFRILDSKYADNNNSECLQLQISYEDVKRVIFTGSKPLIDVIQQVARKDFPFITKIVRIKETKQFNFT